VDTRLEVMERRVVDQNTSQLEEIHHEWVSCFLPPGWLTVTILHERNATIYGTLFGGKIIFKRMG
jgi:hypothetical protein